MEAEIYDLYIKYLSEEKPDLTKYPKGIRKKTQQYQIISERLFRKNTEAKPTQVITSENVPKLLKLIHSDPTGGHFAVEKTFQKARKDYYWPNMRNSIEAYVKGCQDCQQRKPAVKSQKLNPIPPPTAIMERWHADLIGPLPESTDGKRYAIIAVEAFTKWVEGKALENMDASRIASYINDEIICRHGVMTYLVTDGGTPFNNQTMKTLARNYKFKHIVTSAYHPQANGQVERVNRTVKDALAKMVKGVTNKWADFLPAVLLACNTTQSSTTGYTPYYLMHGREATMPVHKHFPRIGNEEQIDVDQRVAHLTELGCDWLAAARNIQKRQRIQKGQYDKNVKEDIFEVGDKVLLEDSAIKQQYNKKLEVKSTGPFLITKVFNNGTYLIRSPRAKEARTKPVHGNRLIRYYEQPRFKQPQVVIEYNPKYHGQPESSEVSSQPK